MTAPTPLAEAGAPSPPTNLQADDSTKHVGARNLSAALMIFERSYNRISDLMPAFITLCESQLKTGEAGNIRVMGRLNLSIALAKRLDAKIRLSPVLPKTSSPEPNQWPYLPFY